MNDFNEAILELKVLSVLADVYKKAIEREHDRYWAKNTLRDANGKVVQEEVKSVWSGNYCHVNIINDLSSNQSILTITLLSHTLPNLKDTVDWYAKTGAEVVYSKYGNEKRT